MIINSEIITTIIIATIVMIPGIWALIYQARKEKENNITEAVYTNTKLIEYIQGMQTRVSKLDNDFTKETLILSEPLKTSNTVLCGHCGSHNPITNFNCSQCGAPAGRFKEIK